MAKFAQNFAGQAFFELFGDVFSNVTLRLVSRNPSGGTGFRLVNASRMTPGGKRSNVLNVLDLLCGQHRAQPGVAGLLKRGTKAGNYISISNTGSWKSTIIIMNSF
jgi:hypothetical protein